VSTPNCSKPARHGSVVNGGSVQSEAKEDYDPLDVVEEYGVMLEIARIYYSRVGPAGFERFAKPL